MFITESTKSRLLYSKSDTIPSISSQDENGMIREPEMLVSVPVFSSFEEHETNVKNDRKNKLKYFIIKYCFFNQYEQKYGLIYQIPNMNYFLTYGFGCDIWMRNVKFIE